MASKRMCGVDDPFSKTRGSLAMSSRVMTGSMMHPRGSAAICQCRGGSITGSWSIRKDQPRPAHGREGLDIHYGLSKKTQRQLSSFDAGRGCTRGASPKTGRNVPLASKRWCGVDNSSSKARRSLAMSSQVMPGFTMHPRGSAAVCQCRGGSITGSWSIRMDQPRTEHEKEGLDIHCGSFKNTSDNLPALTRGVAVLMAHPQRQAAMCHWQANDGAELIIHPQRPAVAWQCQVGSCQGP